MNHFRQSISCPFLTEPTKARESFKSAWLRVQKKLKEGSYPFIDVLNDQKGLSDILAIAKLWEKRFEHIVILGTGGSSLGGKTLVSLKQNPFKRPKLIFMDNVDPKTFDYLFESINLKTTGFLVISKSGTTAETLCQFLCILNLYRESNLSDATIAQHFLVITEPTENTLRSLSKKLGCQILDHHPQVGGRFSVFTNVGLLPAAIGGIDIASIRQGAQEYCTSNLQFVIDAVAMQFQGIQEGYNISVIIPYIDSLQPFAAWFCQLWAESLGKDRKGTTPVRALGTVDQHSQLQLYQDGPQDKCFTFIYKSKQVHDYPVSSETDLFPDLSYLKQKNMGDLLEAEIHATSTSLSSQGCPTRLIRLETFNEKSLGALLVHFMLETIFMAELLQVNAFNQPGVEASKILTRQFLQERVAS
jgi:glucose-6-phosphate isomerase